MEKQLGGVEMSDLGHYDCSLSEEPGTGKVTVSTRTGKDMTVAGLPYFFSLEALGFQHTRITLTSPLSSDAS